MPFSPLAHAVRDGQGGGSKPVSLVSVGSGFAATSVRLVGIHCSAQSKEHVLTVAFNSQSTFIQAQTLRGQSVSLFRAGVQFCES